MLLVTERATATIFFDLASVGNRHEEDVLYLSIHATKNIALTALSRKIISAKVGEILSALRQEVRRAVIDCSIRSRDINSFAFRLARAFKAEFIPADDIDFSF
jgi:hypothetical protein